jgi:hypothetical protein
MTGMVNHFSPYLTKHNKKTKTYMILEIGTDTKTWLAKTSYWDANPLLLDNWIYNTLIEVGLANILKEPGMPVISPRFLCRQTAFFFARAMGH